MNEMVKKHQVSRYLLAAFATLLMIAGSTISATAEIQATPVVEPTPTPVATGREPGDQDELQSDARQQAGTSGASLDSCRQSSEIVAIGGSISVDCTLTISTAEDVSDLAGRVARPSMPNNYTATISMTYGGASSSLPNGSQAGATHLSTGPAQAGEVRSLSVTIEIHAPPFAVPNSQFEAEFTACLLNASLNSCDPAAVQSGSARITATVDPFVLVEGTHFSLTCTDAVPGGFDAESVSTCTLSRGSGLGTRDIRVDQIVTSMNEVDGWSVYLADGSGNPMGSISDSVMNVPADSAIITATDTAFQFQIRLTPTGCVIGQSAPVVSVKTMQSPIQITDVVGPSVTSSPQFVTVDLPEAEQTVSAEVLAGPEKLNVPYSMTEAQSGRTSFTIRYTVSGCTSWTGSAQMTPFSAQDGSTPEQVPELESAAHGSTTVGNDDTTITIYPIQTIEEASTQILSGTGSGEQVIVDHEIHLDYTIPPNTPAGSYHSTITVTTTSDAP